MKKIVHFMIKALNLVHGQISNKQKFLRVSATPEMHLDGRYLEFQNGHLFSCKAC